jgi:hypothetical protein
MATKIKHTWIGWIVCNTCNTEIPCVRNIAISYSTDENHPQDSDESMKVDTQKIIQSEKYTCIYGLNTCHVKWRVIDFKDIHKLFTHRDIDNKGSMIFAALAMDVNNNIKPKKPSRFSDIDIV